MDFVVVGLLILDTGLLVWIGYYLWTMAKRVHIIEVFGGSPDGYCLKCREMVIIKNPVMATVGGRPAVRGVCPVCGVKVFRIRGKRSVDEPEVRALPGAEL